MARVWLVDSRPHIYHHKPFNGNSNETLPFYEMFLYNLPDTNSNFSVVRGFINFFMTRKDVVTIEETESQ